LPEPGPPVDRKNACHLNSHTLNNIRKDPNPFQHGIYVNYKQTAIFSVSFFLSQKFYYNSAFLLYAENL